MYKFLYPVSYLYQVQVALLKTTNTVAMRVQLYCTSSTPVIVRSNISTVLYYSDSSCSVVVVGERMENNRYTGM